jgi:hypothetical protein
MATPGIADQGPVAVAVRTARAALVPLEIDDAAVDAVIAWTTGSLDRHRMGDRLQDLRAQPWADASGEGARLRLAAARGALSRLVAHSPDISGLASPDVTVIAGGAFAVAPPRAVAMAIADTVRRTGATQLAFDHARLLGPIGTIDDPDERRELLADLADDLLAPIGSLSSSAAPRHRGANAGERPAHARRRQHGRHDLSAARSPSSTWRPETGPWRRSSSATPCGSASGRARVAVPVPAASRAWPSTCATCRCACPSAAIAGAPRSPRGASSPGRRRAVSADDRHPERRTTAAQRAGLALVSRTDLIATPLDAFFALRPVIDSLVKAGEAVGRGKADRSSTIATPARSWSRASRTRRAHRRPADRWAEPSEQALARGRRRRQAASCSSAAVS